MSGGACTGMGRGDRNRRIELCRRYRRPTSVAALYLVVVVVGNWAHAQEETRAAQWVSPAQLMGQIKGATTAEQRQLIIDRLKGGAERWPHHEGLHVALALAYYRDGNKLWALRVLGEYQLRWPPACASKAVEAWIRLHQAELALAEELTGDRACAHASPEVRARMRLLRAKLAEARDDSAAVEQQLRRAAQSGSLYAEDAALLDELEAKYMPGWLPKLAWRLSAAVGYTSNGLGGTPLDVEASGLAPSGLGQLEMGADYTPIQDGAIRPVLGVGYFAHQLTARSSEELSYHRFSLRPGVLFGRVAPRLRVGYRGEGLLLHGGDRYESGPLWYAEGHAAEAEVTVGQRFASFVSLGYRSFRERVRSRIELDHGWLMAGELNDVMSGAFGGSLRGYAARHAAYDQVGVTGVGSLHSRLSSGWQLRQRLSVSLDGYPNSERYFSGAGGKARREWSSYFGIELRRALGAGLSLGAELSRSHRNSRADSYDFEEFRGMLRLGWSSSSRRAGRRTVTGEAATLLPWSRPNSLGDDDPPDVRELLRQDESVSRGASCLK